MALAVPAPRVEAEPQALRGACHAAAPAPAPAPALAPPRAPFAGRSEGSALSASGVMLPRAGDARRSPTRSCDIERIESELWPRSPALRRLPEVMP